MHVISTAVYEKQAKRLLTTRERAAAEAEIVARPDVWPVIQGTGGARKARIAIGGRGKRGGGRLIYFFAPSPSVIVFPTVYGKATKEDLTDADKRAIRAALQEFRTAHSAWQSD
jgi:hypothetical protein